MFAQLIDDQKNLIANLEAQINQAQEELQAIDAQAVKVDNAITTITEAAEDARLYPELKIIFDRIFGDPTKIYTDPLDESPDSQQAPKDDSPVSNVYEKTDTAPGKYEQMTIEAVIATHKAAELAELAQLDASPSVPHSMSIPSDILDETEKLDEDMAIEDEAIDSDSPVNNLQPDEVEKVLEDEQVQLDLETGEIVSNDIKDSTQDTTKDPDPQRSLEPDQKVINSPFKIGDLVHRGTPESCLYEVQEVEETLAKVICIIHKTPSMVGFSTTYNNEKIELVKVKSRTDAAITIVTRTTSTGKEKTKTFSLYNYGKFIEKLAKDSQSKNQPQKSKVKLTREISYEIQDGMLQAYLEGKSRVRLSKWSKKLVKWGIGETFTESGIIEGKAGDYKYSAILISHDLPGAIAALDWLATKDLSKDPDKQPSVTTLTDATEPINWTKSAEEIEDKRPDYIVGDFVNIGLSDCFYRILSIDGEILQLVCIYHPQDIAIGMVLDHPIDSEKLSLVEVVNHTDKMLTIRTGGGLKSYSIPQSFESEEEEVPETSKSSAIFTVGDHVVIESDKHGEDLVGKTGVVTALLQLHVKVKLDEPVVGHSQEVLYMYFNVRRTKDLLVSAAA